MSQDAATTPKVSIVSSLTKVGQTLQRYMTLWFVLLLVLVYGFVLYRIQAAQSAQPTDTEISSQLQATPAPHVDPKVVEQMQSLQDHSVNVKTLFDEARSNPFKE